MKVHVPHPGTCAPHRPGYNLCVVHTTICTPVYVQPVNYIVYRGVYTLVYLVYTHKSFTSFIFK